MHLYKTPNGPVLRSPDGQHYALPTTDWDVLVNRDDLHDHLTHLISSGGRRSDATLTDAPDDATLLPPIGQQEVWAAGVTYLRSRDARMEESRKAGGDSFYDRVYDADRPEIFFKAAPWRVVGPGQPVRIRKDSAWDVPEPELTLFITSNGNVVGYTVGNDMSSRSIEGENPLYLPQAKTYDGSAALGPCLYVPAKPIATDAQISLEILRAGAVQFSGSIGINQMKRSHTELAGFLFRELSFPHGAYLMTGTGLVPPDSFTLAVGDEIRITIDGIGTLTNVVM